MGSLSRLAAGLVVIPLGIVIGLLGGSITRARVPPAARQLPAMVRAVDAGQAVSGRFEAGLRDLVPGSPLTRWLRGWVLITPQSVVWVRRMTGGTRDLTGAQCTGERDLDWGYTDLTLSLPDYYGSVRIVTLHANGTDVELAAPVQLLEIIRYSLARTIPGET